MAKYSIKDVELWAEEYKKCYSYRDTGKKFGVNEVTIRNYLILKYKDHFNIQTLEEYQNELYKQGLKKCLGPSGCGKIKPLDDFYFRQGEDKYRNDCKECFSKRSKKYRDNNKETVRAGRKKYSENNKETIKLGNKRYYENNKEKVTLTNKKWQENNKEKVKKYKRAWERDKLKNDVGYKIRRNLRTRVRDVVKRNRKAGSAVGDLGCSSEELIVYLEKQFYEHPETKIQMSWENYGPNWHIDHIIPLAIFDLTDREQFLEACHYTNLQPLWIDDHNIKTIKDKIAIKHRREEKQNTQTER